MSEPRIAKDPALAVVLSFLCFGLGQVYNGQYAKGLLFMVLYAMSWWSMVLLVGFVTTPVLWLYGMWDAHTTAQQINAGLTP
jgi:TM2 domain-containing membrane protein YozV